MLWRTAVIFKPFWAKSLTGLLVKNFRLVLSIRHVMSFAQQAEQTLVFNINRPPHLSFNTKWHRSLFSQLCWNLSLLGVNKRLAHAQVGLLKRFNSKFPTNIPDPFIWKPPPGLKIYILRDSVTAWHVTKNSKNPVRGGSSSGHFSRLTSGRELTV